MTHAPRRVAVTGMGLITPLGNDVATNWESLVCGRSGIGAVTRFDASALPVRIAGEIRGFDPGAFLEAKAVKKMDPFIHYAVAAAQMAVDDSGLSFERMAPERCGVLMGVGMGGVRTMEESLARFLAGGIKHLTAFFVPRVLANMAPGQIAIRFGLKGVSYAVTSACASGAHAIGEAARAIRHGSQDVMLAGGAEAGITAMGIAGFAVMRALSTRNDEPARASRPFDLRRDGFVAAEGAGVLVLEALDAAIRRGARIYGEVAGYGANTDGYHMTQPSPDGEGAAACMRLAMADAGLGPADIDYVNAHGTSTPANDVIETVAIKKVLGEHARRVPVSSTKSMTGHTLGAAGAVEASYTLLALHHGTLPPTINYEIPDPECDLDYVPNQARALAANAALSNSFGFGGANACLALRRWNGE